MISKKIRSIKKKNKKLCLADNNLEINFYIFCDNDVSEQLFKKAK